MAEPKKSVQEFAQAIKAKYPQYKDIDDYTLAKKIVAKYPQYADAVEFDEKKKASGEPSEESASAPQSTLPKTLAETRPSVAPIQEVEEVDEFAKNVVDRKAEAKKANFETSGSINTRVRPTALPTGETKEEEDYFTGGFGQFLTAMKSPFNPVGSAIADFVDDMGRAVGAGMQTSATVSPSMELLEKGRKTSDEDINKYIEVAKSAQKIKPSDEMQSFTDIYEKEGKGIFGVLKGLANNPTVIPEVMVSSIAGMINPNSLASAGAVIGGATAVGAATTGPGALVAAAGSLPFAMGAATATMEAGLTFSELLNEELTKRGMDFTKDNVRTLLNDEKLVSSLRMRALGRGMTIGVVDGMTGQLAGSVGAKAATTTAGKAGRIAAAGGIEMAGGSAGEVAGRAVAGQEMDVAEIALEGISEAPGTVVDIASVVGSRPSYVVNGEKISETKMRDIMDNASPADLAGMDIKIKNDVNKYGEKITDAVETDAITKEVKATVPNISEENVSRIVGLEKELKKLSTATTQTAKDRVSEIKSEIKSLREPAAQPEAEVALTTKQQQDAVQEQAAGEVPVQPEAEAGREVAQGEPQAEPQVATQEGLTEEVQVETPAVDVTIESPFDEFGEPDYDAEDAVREIAKQRDLGITSDRELATVARDANGNVIGGAFTSYDNNTGEYTFDVVVSEDAEGKGVGSKLLDAVKDLPGDLQDMNPDAKVKVDVVNPNMQKMLEKRGFVVTEKTGEDRVTMEPSSQVKEQKTAKLTTKKSPAPKVKKTQEELDLEAQEQQLRALEDDIQIEKDNFVERKAEIAEQIKEARASKLSAPEKAELVASLRAELEDAKNESNAIIGQYREDAKALKKDVGKAKAKLQKKVQQAAPKAAVEPVAPAAPTMEVPTMEAPAVEAPAVQPFARPGVYSPAYIKTKLAEAYKKLPTKKFVELFNKHVDSGLTEDIAKTSIGRDGYVNLFNSDDYVKFFKDAGVQLAKEEAPVVTAEEPTTSRKTEAEKLREAQRALLLKSGINPDVLNRRRMADGTPTFKKLSKIAETARKAVAKIMPDLKIVVYNDVAEYSRATGDAEHGQYNPSTKTIHINGTRATPSTIAHEVFHAVFLNKVKNDPTAQRIASTMIESIKRIVGKDSEIYNFLEDFSSQYKDNFKDEEKLAELVAILSDFYAGNRTYGLSEKAIQSFKNAIKKFIQDFADAFGIDLQTKLDDAQVMAMLNTIARKTISGKEITNEDLAIIDKLVDTPVGEQVRKDARQRKGLITLTEKDVIKYSKIGVVDQRMAQAMESIGLSGVKFTETGVKEAVSKKFLDVRDEYLNNETYEGEIPFIHKGGQAMKESIINEAETAYERSDISESKRDSLIRNSGDEIFQRKYVEEYAKTQKREIERWIKYLEQSSYDDAFKYMIFDAVLTFNYDLNTGQYKKRAADTMRGITTFDSGVLAKLYESDSKELLKSYVELMQQNSVNVVKEHKYQSTDKGTWVKFEGGSKNPDLNEEASALSQMVQETPWCTKELAYSQLSGGDFYVFVTGEDNPKPRVAVRMSGKRVGEARGIEGGSSQVIEESMQDTADKFLREEVTGGEEYIRSIAFAKNFKALKSDNPRLTRKTIEDIKELYKSSKVDSSKVATFVKDKIKNDEVDEEIKDEIFFMDTSSDMPGPKVKYIFNEADGAPLTFFGISGEFQFDGIEAFFGDFIDDSGVIGTELMFNNLTAIYGNFKIDAGGTMNSEEAFILPKLKTVYGNLEYQGSAPLELTQLESISGNLILRDGNLNKRYDDWIREDIFPVEDFKLEKLPVLLPSLKSVDEVVISNFSVDLNYLETVNSISVDNSTLKKIGIEDYSVALPSLKSINEIDFFSSRFISDLSSLKKAERIYVYSGVKLDSLESVKELRIEYADNIYGTDDIRKLLNNLSTSDSSTREEVLKNLYEYVDANNLSLELPSLKEAQSIYANNSLLKSLGDLKSVGNISVAFSESLVNLEYVSGDLNILKLVGGSIGKLREVGGLFYVSGISRLKTPSKLERIGRLFLPHNVTGGGIFPALKSIGSFDYYPSKKPFADIFPSLEEIGLPNFPTVDITTILNHQSENPEEAQRLLESNRKLYLEAAKVENKEYLEDIANKTFDAQVELIRTGIELNTQAPRQRKADGKAPLKQRIEEIRKAAESKRNERMAAREKGMSEAARKFKAEQEAKAKVKQEAKEQKAKIETAMDGYINAILESGNAKTIAAAFKNFQEVAGKLDKTEFVQQLRRTIAKLKEDKHISTVSAGNLNRILRTIERVSPATYALEVDRAMNAVKKEINTQLRKQLNTNRKKALKNIQSGRIGNSTIKPLFQRVLSIDASMIPDESFDDYIAIVTRLGAKQTVLPLADRRAMETTLNNILNNIDAEAGRLIELGEMYNDFVSSRNLGDTPYSEVINQMKGEGLITEDEVKMMKRYKSIILSEAKVAKAGKRAESPEARAALEEELSNIDINVRALENRDDRAIATAIQDNLDAASEMTSQDLRKLLLVIDNINNGFLPHMGEVVRRKLVSINDGKKLASALNKVSLPLGEKIIVNVKGALMRLMGRKSTETGTVSLAAERNPAAFIDEVFGNFKTTPIYDTLIRPMASAFSRFQRDFDVAVNKLNAAERKLYDSKKTDNEFRSSMYKIQMYLIQREYESNVGNPEVSPATKWIKATIDAIDAGNIYNEATASELREQLTKFSEDGEVSIEKIEKSLTPAEKGLIKAIDEVNGSIRDKAVHVSDVIRGEGIEARDNYVHIQVYGDGKGSPLDEISNFTNRYTPSTKAKSLITRTGQVNPINLDPYQTAVRGLKMTLLDYYMTPAIKQVNGTLAESKNLIDSGSEKNLTAVSELMKGFNQGVLENAVGSSVSPDITDTLVTNGYRAVLASVRRAIAETASNITFALANPAQFTAGVKSYYKLDSDISAGDVLRNVGSVHTTRLFGGETLTSPMVEKSGFRNTGGVKTEMQPDVINKMARISKLGRIATNKIADVADFLMSTPDAMVSRPIWFGAFENNFKELTGKEPDLKKISDNDEAYMEANRDSIKKASKEADKQVTQAAASNNPYETIAKLRVNEKDTSSKKIYKAVNGFISRFAIFEYNTARRAIYAMIGNGSISRKEGAALLTGVAMRSIVYVMASSYIGGIMSALAQSALANLGWAGLEEEEEEDDLMEAILPNADTLPKLYRSIGGALANIFINRNFGNVIKNINGMLVETANEEYGQFLRNGKDYDPFENNILMNQLSSAMTPGNSNEKIASFVAAFAGPLSPVARTFISTFKLANSAINNKTAASRKENLDELKIRVPLEFAGNLGLVPVYNDVRKMTLDYFRDDLNKEKDFRQEVKRLINQYPNGGEKFEKEMDKTFAKYTRFKTRQAINKQKELLEDN
jgi:GNAT superfamily N-acetyltransferase